MNRVFITMTVQNRPMALQGFEALSGSLQCMASELSNRGPQDVLTRRYNGTHVCTDVVISPALLAELQREEDGRIRRPPQDLERFENAYVEIQG